jgi:hypothetical protein
MPRSLILIRPRELLVTLLVLCLPLLQSGCGDGLPKTYPVKGKVLFKGGKPMTSGTVMVQSAANPEVPRQRRSAVRWEFRTVFEHGQAWIGRG